MEREDSQDKVHAAQRKEALSYWTPVWNEATKLQKFTNGDQWPEGDRKQLDKNRAPRISFNEIRIILQTLGGKEIIQRFERGYIPRHASAARQAEIMTAIDRAMMHACDAEQVVSAAFKDGPGIQGISAVRWELDTLNERGGGLLLTDLPIWQVMADPEARAVNLSDRSWHLYGKWYPQSEVKRRWPEKYEQLKGRHGGKPYNESEPGKSSRIPWTGMEGNVPLQPYAPKQQAWWIEYKEWRQVEIQYEVSVPVGEGVTYDQALTAADDSLLETQTFRSKAELEEFKKEWLAITGEDVPDVAIIDKPTLVYHYAYLCGDDELETGVIPTGYWTIQFLTGFRFPLPDKVLWRSLVSGLVDPQKWVNVMMSSLIRQVQINPKGVLFVEEGFFANQNEAMASWSAPGGLIRVRRGALSGGDSGFRHVAMGSNPYSQMIEGLMAVWKDAIPRFAGFNPASLGQLGSDLRRISGEVVRQVQDAAMTSNAELFDALRHHRREGGRIFLSFLSAHFEVEDIIRIIGEDTAYEVQMQPAIDPMTGQPMINLQTGAPLMQPVIDPATGAPVRVLMVPPKSAWTPDWWKEIGIEDVVPSGDQLQVLWKSLETAPQIFFEPRPDTGAPLFSSEDLIDIIPNIPAQRREKMRQRLQAALVIQQQQQAQQAQIAQQQPQEEQVPQEG